MTGKDTYEAIESRVQNIIHKEKRVHFHKKKRVLSDQKLLQWLEKIQPQVFEFVDMLQRAESVNGFATYMTPNDINRILVEGKKKHFLQ